MRFPRDEVEVLMLLLVVLALLVICWGASDWLAWK